MIHTGEQHLNKQLLVTRVQRITNWSTNLPAEESELSGVNLEIWRDRRAVCVSQCYFQKLVWFCLNHVSQSTQGEADRAGHSTEAQDSCSEKGAGSAFECLCIFSLTLATVQHILSGGWGADSRDMHTLFWGAVAESSPPLFKRRMI